LPFDRSSERVAAVGRPDVAQAGSVPWLAIAAVIVTLGIFAVTMGLTYPLLALVLEAQGVDAALIGLNAAMTPLGLLAFSLVIPKVAQRFGAWQVVVASIALTGLVLLALGATRSLALWFLLRFLLGIGINGLYVVSETWINQLSTAKVRGRVMGLYATVLSGGFAAGPFTLSLTGPDGWAPFLIGAGAAFASLPLLFLARRSLPAFADEQGPTLLRFLPLAPVLLTAVAILALFDQAVLSLLPIYALRHGLGEATAAAIVGVLAIGNVLLQYPIGWLSDRLSRRAVMIGCAVLAMAGSLALPFAITAPVALWPLLILWGAVAFGVFTVALAELGDRFTGALLLAGNAAFAFMWGIGGIIGPPVAGGAMRLLGPEGLPLTLAASFAALALLAALRRDKG
jgi:MFS family permease